MPVTIKINGRDALPIRSIPYVASWKWNSAPDDIVCTLSSGGMFAFQMDAQDNYEQVPPEQWESWVVTLDSLTKKLQANERAGADGENWESWRIGAVLKLPDNVFIWLDEFQDWYSKSRPLDVSGDHSNDYSKWERNQERLNAKRMEPGSELTESEWAMLDEAPPESVQESDKLCLSPILPPEIENRLWRYAKGFDATKPEGVQESIVIHHYPNTTVIAGQPVTPQPDAAVEATTIEQPETKAAVAEKIGTNKKTWDDSKLRALWEESLQPGVTNTILAKRHGVSHQRISTLIAQARVKFSTLGSTKKNQYSGLLVHKMGD